MVAWTDPLKILEVSFLRLSEPFQTRPMCTQSRMRCPYRESKWGKLPEREELSFAGCCRFHVRSALFKSAVRQPFIETKQGLTLMTCPIHGFQRCKNNMPASIANMTRLLAIGLSVGWPLQGQANACQSPARAKSATCSRPRKRGLDPQPNKVFGHDSVDGFLVDR